MCEKLNEIIWYAVHISKVGGKKLTIERELSSKFNHPKAYLTKCTFHINSPALSFFAKYCLMRS